MRMHNTMKHQFDMFIILGTIRYKTFDTLILKCIIIIKTECLDAFNSLQLHNNITLSF